MKAKKKTLTFGEQAKLLGNMVKDCESIIKKYNDKSNIKIKITLQNNLGDKIVVGDIKA